MGRLALALESLCILALLGVGMCAACLALPYFLWKFLREEA